jgi:hypothetical protein
MEHDDEHNVCAITDCTQRCVEGLKTCGMPDHQEMEVLHNARGTAAFVLKQRLLRHQISHLNDPLAGDVAAGVSDVQETVEWFEVHGGKVSLHEVADPGSVGVTEDSFPCDSKLETGNRKYKAQFGRRRTHNEQTLVRPCGVNIFWCGGGFQCPGESHTIWHM